MRAEQIADERRAMEPDLVSRSDVYVNFVEQMRRVYGEGQHQEGLNQTHRILIAVGMAVQNGHESAIEWTVTRALNHGASERMVLDAIDVALLNGGTFVTSNARFAYNTLALRWVRPRGS